MLALSFSAEAVQRGRPVLGGLDSPRQVRPVPESCSATKMLTRAPARAATSAAARRPRRSSSSRQRTSSPSSPAPASRPFARRDCGDTSIRAGRAGSSARAGRAGARRDRRRCWRARSWARCSRSGSCRSRWRVRCRCVPPTRRRFTRGKLTLPRADAPPAGPPPRLVALRPALLLRPLSHDRRSVCRAPPPRHLDIRRAVRRHPARGRPRRRRRTGRRVARPRTRRDVDERRCAVAVPDPVERCTGA